MFCSKCGNQIENDARFCGYCGTNFDVEKEQQPTNDGLYPQTDMNQGNYYSYNMGTYVNNPGKNVNTPKKISPKIWIAIGASITAIIALVVIIVVLGKSGSRSNISSAERSDITEYHLEEADMSRSEDSTADYYSDGRKLAQIAQEISEAPLTAELYQVYDAVIKTDGSLTVSEAFEVIQQGTDFEVSLDVSYGDEVNDVVRCNYYNVRDEDKKTVCRLVAYDEIDKDNDDFSLKVVNVEPGKGIHFYNCILPSGIVPVFNNSSKPENDDEVAASKKRLEEMGGEVPVDKIEDWLRSHGVTHIQNMDDWNAYVFSVFPKESFMVIDGTKEILKAISWTIKYNESEGYMSVISTSVSIGPRGIFNFDPAMPLFSELDDAVKAETIAMAEDGIYNNWNYGSKVSGLQFQTFAQSTKRGKKEKFYNIFTDDQQRYVAIDVSVDYTYGGTIAPVAADMWDGKFFNSIEECMKEYELTLVED